MYERDRCVAIVHGEAQAEQVRSFLRASGILCEFRGEAVRKTLTVAEFAAVEILVSEADEEEAKRLLQSVEAGEFHLDEDIETES
jgi:hypothetical protein